MDKQKVQSFFDALAPAWDADLIHDDAKINEILDAAGIVRGVRVLDIACGTGVLFGDYLARGASEIVGVDISQKMLDEAHKKYAGEAKISLLCADAESLALGEKFDCCVIYNAFPHFANPDTLFKSLAGSLKSGGRLTVAHGFGRQKIDAHHSGTASEVSNGLVSAEEMCTLLRPYITPDTATDRSDVYIVSGTKP